MLKTEDEGFYYFVEKQYAITDDEPETPTETETPSETETPPMAPALFVTAKATGNKFETALKYTVQFLIPMFITLMITTFWEPLTMFLPRLLGSM